MALGQVKLRFNHKLLDFAFREDSGSDQGVIRTIFSDQDYDISRWHQGLALVDYHLARSASAPSLIVDAGANIGASAVYFLNQYENAFVFAIEPDMANWKLLELNTRDYPRKLNFYGAVAGEDGELRLVDPGLSDCGFRTEEVGAAAQDAGLIVEAISPASILEHPATAGMNPLIFKIDIEGGEDSLFRGNTEWMRRFPLLIIELHDWMLPFSGSSRNFLRALANCDFDLVHRGENLFLFNREILRP